MYEREILERIERLERAFQRQQVIEGGGGGVTIHGVLEGLDQHDHLQYPLDGEVVHNTGNETVGGIKTFSGIPVLPGSNPTSSNQAARKAYVDGQISGLLQFVPLQTPIVSATYNDTSYTSSHTATRYATSEFSGLPSGVKALAVRMTCQDSNSEPHTWLNFSVGRSTSHLNVICRPSGVTNYSYKDASGIVVLDSLGRFGVQVQPSGTMRVWLYCYGYWV